jgi:hypothetical protein
MGVGVSEDWVFSEHLIECKVCKEQTAFSDNNSKKKKN